MGAASNVPFGIKVPSKNVKSFKALRERVTNELSDRDQDRPRIQMNATAATDVHPFDALALLEEAIDFPHLAHCNLRPSVLLNDAFNLLTKGLDVLRIRCKIKERLSEKL